MSERVLAVVLGRVPRWVNGEVEGFDCAPLENGRCYPGAYRKCDTTLKGRVLCDVTPEELSRLDRFEGDEYNPVVVPNVRIEGGSPVSARMWLLSDSEVTRIRPGRWSFDKFLEEDEGWYVKMCMEWREEDDTEQRNSGQGKRQGK